MIDPDDVDEEPTQEHAVVNPILHLLLADNPSCGCCNSDDAYMSVVIRALALTPEVEWPPLHPAPECFKRRYTPEQIIDLVALERRRMLEEDADAGP